MQEKLYTPREVSDMLDDSLTDSTASTESEKSDLDTDSEFDLSDPEALAEKEGSVIPRGSDVATDIQETNEFVSVSVVQDTLSDTPVFTSADMTISNEDSQTTWGDNEDHIHVSDTTFVRGLSEQGQAQVGRTRGRTNRRAQRGRGSYAQSQRCGRGRSSERARNQGRRTRSCGARSRGARSRGARSHGARSRGIRSHSARGRGKGYREQRPERESLNIESTLTKTDAVTTIFPFTPPTGPGFYIPDNVDTSDPESLFRLFFSDDIIEYICRASDEYADLLQDRRKVMYNYYKGMSP